MSIILGPHKKTNAPFPPLFNIATGVGFSSRNPTNVKEWCARQRCRTLVDMKELVVGPEILGVSQTEKYFRERGNWERFEDDDGGGDGRVDGSASATAAAPMASEFRQ